MKYASFKAAFYAIFLAGPAFGQQVGETYVLETALAAYARATGVLARCPIYKNLTDSTVQVELIVRWRYPVTTEDSQIRRDQYREHLLSMAGAEFQFSKDEAACPNVMAQQAYWDMRELAWGYIGSHTLK